MESPLLVTDNAWIYNPEAICPTRPRIVLGMVTEDYFQNGAYTFVSIRRSKHFAHIHQALGAFVEKRTFWNWCEELCTVDYIYRGFVGEEVLEAIGLPIGFTSKNVIPRIN